MFGVRGLGVKPGAGPAQAARLLQDTRLVALNPRLDDLAVLDPEHRAAPCAHRGTLRSLTRRVGGAIRSPGQNLACGPLAEKFGWPCLLSRSRRTPASPAIFGGRRERWREPASVIQMPLTRSAP